jgi:hypothetical protein
MWVSPGSGIGARCRIVIDALCYKQEGRGFEIPSGNSVLSICLILSAALGPGVRSVSNRTEYQREK